MVNIGGGYMVVQTLDLSDLENEVDKHLEDGWKLQGGVCITYMGESSSDGSIVSYAQAMVHIPAPTAGRA